MFDSDGKMEKIDARLRVREIRSDKTDLIEFSFKQRLHEEGDLGDGVEKQKEVQIEIDGSQKEGFLEILNLMGYTKTTSYERFREKYIIDEVELVIDKFPFGYIVELEAESKEKIIAVLTKLGLDSKESTKMSCDDVYDDLCKKNSLEIKPDIEFDDPDMPKLMS